MAEPTLGKAQLIAWLAEEYRRCAMLHADRERSGAGTTDVALNVLDGRMRALADVEFMVRNGVLPQHQPVSLLVQWRDAAISRELDQFELERGQ